MRNIFRISLATLAITTLMVSFVGRAASAAGTATYYLSPASGTYTVGNTISVDIMENSGTDNINATTVKLTYSASTLTYQSVTTGSHWDYAPATSGGGGSISLDRAHCEPDVNNQCTPLSGAIKVATVNFTAAAAGQATISFGAGTVLYRTSDNGAETLTMTGATYTINAPATPPPSGGTSGGTSGGSTSGTSGSTTTTKTSTSTAPKTSTPLASTPTPSTTTTPAQPSISDIEVKNLSDSSATITWKTSVPTTSEVDYGSDTHYGFTATDNNLTTDHSIVLDPSYLVAGKTYHYLIKSVDAKGNLITSKDITFQTQLAGAKTKPHSNVVWEILATLLVVVAAGLLGLAYFKHLLPLHHVAPLAGAGPGTGAPIAMHHSTPVVINPSESKADKNTVPKSEPKPPETPASKTTNIPVDQPK